MATTHTIAEVATALGVSHRTLRFYEHKGLVSPQRKGTARLYSPADVARLGQVMRLKACGASLDEIVAIQSIRDVGDALSTATAERALAEALAVRAKEGFAEASARLQSVGELIGKANWRNGKANAHLMAAGPDLYAALAEAKALIEGDAVGSDWKRGCREFLRNARAALSRARGETPNQEPTHAE